MRLTAYKLALSLCIIHLAHMSLAQAQTPAPDPTPRQVFTAFATDTPLPKLKFKPLGAPVLQPLDVIETRRPVSDQPLKPKTSQIAASPVIDAHDKSTAGTQALKDTAALVVPVLETKTAPNTQRASLSGKPSDDKKSPVKADLAPAIELLPFYTSAREYLKRRETETQTQLKLTYKITVKTKDGRLGPEPVTRIITLGPDFVAAKQENKTQIYDFKTDRLLTLRSSDKETVFDNVSLYAGAIKNVNTVSKATKNGTQKSLTIGNDTALDAFWLEASLGWSARREFPNLKTTRVGDQVVAAYKTVKPFTASLSGPVIPSENHMRALFAWWHHDLAIHPAILPDIGRPDKAPEIMEILSLSPKFPGGLTATWRLEGSELIEEAFPLPETAKTSVEMQKSTPLAFAISEAANGKALRQRPTPGDLRQEILEKREAGNPFETWLASQILAERVGGCEKSSVQLCKNIKTLESRAEPGSDLAKLPAIIRQSREAKTRIEAFEALYPYVAGEIAPAFLVKIAGQTRARIKSSRLSNPEHKALKADRLLEEALVKDPYDPDVYLTLGQVYAAQGQLAESWDIQDAMRLLPDVKDKHVKAINRAENSLRSRAPGFFLHKGR